MINHEQRLTKAHASPPKQRTPSDQPENPKTKAATAISVVHVQKDNDARVSLSLESAFVAC
jgi:hypothetical protein